jgi:uncharacterized Zn-binding protein involved in type VI secretion
MGQPAARVGDMHVCPMVTPGTPPIPHVGGPIMPPGKPTVLIGSMPAATATNMCTCVGPPDVIVKGSIGVFIGGLPAARMGDTTAHGGTIAMGLPTVLIGDVSVATLAGAIMIMQAFVILELLMKLPPSVRKPVAQAIALKRAAASGAPFCEVCTF